MKRASWATAMPTRWPMRSSTRCLARPALGNIGKLFPGQRPPRSRARTAWRCSVKRRRCSGAPAGGIRQRRFPPFVAQAPRLGRIWSACAARAGRGHGRRAGAVSVKAKNRRKNGLYRLRRGDRSAGGLSFGAGNGAGKGLIAGREAGSLILQGRDFTRDGNSA